MDEIGLLIKQLAQFPNGDHDDGPDALQGAIEAAETLLAEESTVHNPF